MPHVSIASPKSGKANAIDNLGNWWTAVGGQIAKSSDTDQYIHERRLFKYLVSCALPKWDYKTEKNLNYFLNHGFQEQ